MFRRILCILIAVSLLPVGAAVCVGGLLPDDCECGSQESCGRECECAGESPAFATAEQHPGGRPDWTAVDPAVVPLANFVTADGVRTGESHEPCPAPPRPPLASRPFPDSDLPLLI